MNEDAMRTVPNELLLDLGALTLYDHAVIVDDSSSMRSKLAPDVSRGKFVGHILRNIQKMNSVINGSDGRGLKGLYFASASTSVPQGFEQPSTISGESKIGTCLWNEIVRPLLDEKKPKRPLVITIITDGEVDPMEANILERAMLQAARKMQKLRAPGALLFQFVNVGKSSAESNGDGHEMLRVLARQSELARYVDIVDWQRGMCSRLRIIMCTLH